MPALVLTTLAVRGADDATVLSEANYQATRLWARVRLTTGSRRASYTFPGIAGGFISEYCSIGSPNDEELVHLEEALDGCGFCGAAMTQKMVVLGVYSTRGAVDAAINEFRSAGFGMSDISILLSDHSGKRFGSTAETTESGTITDKLKPLVLKDAEQPVAPKVDPNETEPTPGAGIGALAGSAAAGWFATLTALAIPGLGALLVVGPLVGALVGGAAGALTGIGVPESDGKLYEERLQKGSILVSVHVHASADAERAAALFRRTGATDVVAAPEAKSVAQRSGAR